MTDGSAIAIVTGGSRGIGAETVLALARRGVRCILTWRSEAAAAEAVAARAAELGARAVAVRLDVGDASGFGGFAERVEAALRGMGAERFDWLVNNAGTSSRAGLLDATEAMLDEQFAVHFKGPFLLTQTLLPLMRDGGRIVNVSSGLARFTYPGRAVYGPMKAAVEVLTRYMAAELGPRRISVNVVAPGATATDFSGGIVRDDPQVHEAIRSQTALGRVGRAADIGGVIASVLSDEMAWVNAQRIEAAGGVHI